MIQNDILRRLRYALTLNDQKMLALFKEVNQDIKLPHLYAILKREAEDGFELCSDQELNAFLDGLIISKRGRQSGRDPEVWPTGVLLGNNDILRKLRIALELRSEDIIDILKSEDVYVSNSEISAFFRKPDHRSYKICGDQFLRNFLAGLTKRYRPS
jgi:uncharacterized protein YehS (DUF1456 family)